MLGLLLEMNKLLLSKMTSLQNMPHATAHTTLPTPEVLLHQLSLPLLRILLQGLQNVLQSLYLFLFLIFFKVVLEIEPKASHILVKQLYH
jgi:hypothetical protein